MQRLLPLIETIIMVHDVQNAFGFVLVVSLRSASVSEFGQKQN